MASSTEFTTDSQRSSAVTGHSQAAATTTTQDEEPQLSYEELDTCVSNFTNRLYTLLACADIVRSHLSHYRSLIASGTSQHKYTHTSLSSEVRNLQHDAQAHFLHAITLELRVLMYVKLAPNSPSEMRNKRELAALSQRHKLATNRLAEKVRGVEWLWDEISVGGLWAEEPIWKGIDINPYQDVYIHPKDPDSDDENTEV